MAKKSESKSAPVTAETLPIIQPENDSILDSSEMNAGLKVTVRDVMDAKDRERKEREAQRAARSLFQVLGVTVNRQTILADTPYGMQMLHEFEKGVELYIHAWKGDEPCHEICEQHYGIKNCSICAVEGTRFGKSYAIPSKCFITHVYNNVGQTFDKTNSRGETKTYNLQPLKILELPLGKDDCNVISMQEAARRKYFTQDIWLIKREKGKGFLVPRTIAKEDFAKLIGREVSLELPEPALKIATMNQKEIMKIVLSSFNNVRWEELGFKVPVANDTPAETTETKSDNSSRESF